MPANDGKIEDVVLPNGYKMPILGYGTGTAWFKAPGQPIAESTVGSIQMACRTGFRHLDGAEMYNTEEELGAAIKRSGLPREELFITTKVDQHMDNIDEAINISLRKLNLSYVDLFLIHQPFFAKGNDALLQEKWTDMEKVVASGKAKSIGVSNFAKEHLEAIYRTAKVKPCINQVELHPYLQHGDLLEYQRQKGLQMVAYGTLLPITKARGGPLDPLLESLAAKYSVSSAEILLRWCVDQKIGVITTSSSEERLRDYLRIFTFSLTSEEVQQINETGRRHHARGFWTDIYGPDDRT